jgi:hypothetical protein
MGMPVLDSFLKVRGSFQLAASAAVSSPKTLLLHLRLESIAQSFHFVVIEQCLREYCHDKLTALSIPFDLGTATARSDWPAVVEAACSSNNITHDYEHVVVVVTNHSDDDSGDLFLGNDRKGKPIAASVQDVRLFPFICFCCFE